LKVHAELMVIVLRDLDVPNRVAFEQDIPPRLNPSGRHSPRLRDQRNKPVVAQYRDPTLRGRGHPITMASSSQKCKPIAGIA